MGVLVDSNANWTAPRPSPPKKKWMMHYLEEFPSSEDKPSSCYTNGVSPVTPTSITSNSSLGGAVGSVITALTSTPPSGGVGSPLHHTTLPSSTTIINTTHLTTNHITFTNGLPTSLLHTRPQGSTLPVQSPLVERKEVLTNGTTTNHHHLHHHIVETLPPNVQTQVISTTQNGISMGSGGNIVPNNNTSTAAAAVLARQYTLQIAPQLHHQPPDDTALSSCQPIRTAGIRTEPVDIISGESNRLMTHHHHNTSYTTSSGSLGGGLTHHHTNYTNNGGHHPGGGGGGLSTSPNGGMGHGGMDLMKKRTGMSGIREVHNKLEKNRRAHLKECFEILKRQVPPSQEEKKSSNLSILHSAIRYIQFQRRREREFEHEMERLAREKIHAQQRLALLKKELSARWEHIDFNKLIPDTMEVDIPYESRLGGGDQSSFSKGDHSYMDMEEGDGEGGGLVIVTNGGGCGGGESTLYSSSSSLSSTMSPLHNPPSHHLPSLPSTHIQVISSISTVTSSSSSSSPSSLPIHILPGRTPPSSLEPMSLTLHPLTPPSNGGGLKHSPPLPPPSPTVIVTDSYSGGVKFGMSKSPSSMLPGVSPAPAHQSSSISPNYTRASISPNYTRASISPPGGVIQSGNVGPISNGYCSSPTRMTSLGTLGQKSTSPPTAVSTAASVAAMIKSGDVVTPKLIALPHAPSTQVLFTSTHTKMLPSTAPTLLPLPSLQPISTHPHPIILKSIPQPPSLAGAPQYTIANGGARLVMPHKTPITPGAGAVTRIVHK